MPAAVWITLVSLTILMEAARIPNLSGTCGEGVGAASAPKQEKGLTPATASAAAQPCTNPRRVIADITKSQPADYEIISIGSQDASERVIEGGF